MLFRLVAIILTLPVLVPIFYRKLEVRFLFRATRKRKNEIVRLTGMVGAVFQLRNNLITGAGWMTFNDIGYASGKEGERLAPFCWSAPIGITLYLCDIPTFGLGVELRGKALCIRQMQGVRGQRPPRDLQDWPELLVKACMVYAGRTQLKEFRVYKADQDLNFRFPVIETAEGETDAQVVKSHQDRMRRRYDRTAQKLKFEKKKKYYVWKVPEAQKQ